MSHKKSGLAAHLLKFLLFLIIAGGVTLLIAGPAQARGFRHGHGWGWGWGISVGLWTPWALGYYPYYPYDSYPAYAPETVVAPVQVQAAPQSYYYCDAPAGYYPYVASCSRPWRAVPITPQR